MDSIPRTPSRKSNVSSATERHVGIATHYFRECSVCGRSLRVRIELLGQILVCPHCDGRFHAHPHDTQATGRQAGELLARAERLLSLLESTEFQQNVQRRDTLHMSAFRVRSINDREE